MTNPADTPVMTLVMCGAGAAAHVTDLIRPAIGCGWTVQPVATPAALQFLDTDAIEDLTGSPVRSQYSPPGAPRSRVPRVIVVAPATYNTICGWATGRADTYALGILAEQTSLVPCIALPYVNQAYAARIPFRRSVETLRAEGVRVLIGDDGYQPHPPRSGHPPADFPWRLALDAANEVRKQNGTATSAHDGPASRR